MLEISRPIIVEGKYDKIKLNSLVKANIITTDGFGIFNAKEKAKLIRRLAAERGIIVITDSDGNLDSVLKPVIILQISQTCFKIICRTTI